MYGIISLKRGAPSVNIIFNPIMIDIVPTIGPMALLTNEDIIMESEATTIIERVPEQNAQKNLHPTSLLLITVTPRLKTIKSPEPNKKYPKT